MGQLPVSGGLIPLCSVAAGESLIAALTPEEQVEMACELTVSVLEAPVAAGTPVGEIIYYVNSEELARTPLVTGTDIPDDAAPVRGGWPWKNGFKS